ncbi:hypothetical protein [Rhodanobacter sp. L36]|uniref:hypothetical protein n=1 Tax=Rhodanobacter sp. L36 TaxID=1747221 RepID=UPI00131B2A94|nr:hypothetical protein [Rhodanobacter sp. L36]
MKRHLNNLLQRKLAEFEGSKDIDRSRPDQDIETDVLQVRDGYDWLLPIKRAATRSLQA